MGIFYYILMPFSLLLNFFYNISGSYGVALILFAVVVKLILFPFTMKGKKGMIQMNMVSGKMQQLQRQYGKDQQRYQMEVQKLYEREHINPMGGCLWSFLPLLVLIPLYSIIREPLVYLMGLTAEQVAQAAATLNWQAAAVEHGWVTADAMAKLAGQVAEGKIDTVFQSAGYNQMYLASLITGDTLPAVQAALGEAGKNVFAINFSFLGLNLALLPTWKIWQHLNWPYIGAFLLILVSAGSGILMSKISMKTNQMNAGQQQNAQMEKTNRMMMWTMPLMSLYIGFIMPVGLCLYWVAQNLLSMVQEVIAGRLLKKDYEAARLAAEERERQEKEDEKRRREEARLERERRLEEEKKNRGKRKAQKKAEPAQPGINREDSKVGLRAYARGRSYDPNRFGGVTPYRDPSSGEAPEQEEDGLFLKEEPAAEETQPALAAAPEGTEGAPEDAGTAAPAQAEEQAEPELEEIEVEEIEVEAGENDDDKEGV